MRRKQDKKPWFTYNDRTGKLITVEAPTYRELKKLIPEHLLRANSPYSEHDRDVTVTRYRRGEWGQWFEVWTLVYGKTKLIKQGWL